MKGDFSRITFDPAKQYTRVLRQQGRVDLDADHNEESAIIEHLHRTAAVAVIGECGGPWHRAGFEVGPVGAGVPDVRISQGDFYVDGLLCRVATDSVGVGAAVAANRWELETLDVEGSTLASDDWVEIIMSGGEELLVRIVAVDEAESTVTFDRDVSAIDHVTARVRRALTYLAQPYLLDPEELGPAEGRKDLVFLDVWQRHVTALEDPALREVALGGPDTTTRVQTVWQVRVRPGVDTASNCLEVDDWPPAATGGRLSTGTTPSVDPGDPCLIVSGSVYRGVENHLYRVEIHTGGNAGTATFKWSRDNGSIVFGVEDFPALEPNKVKLRTLGRDEVLTIKTGDWIELLDDATEFGPVAGFIAKVESVDEAARILRLADDIPADAFSLDRHPRVRRWDQKENVTSGGVVRTKTTAIELEHGVAVQFAGTDFRPGDHWVFAARTATGEVERLTEAPPVGTRHHYCKLALIEWTASPDGLVAAVDDCRPLFPPATELTSFFYLGGDGQECLPGSELAQPLRVGVSNGSHPVVGARVEFVIAAVDGDGTLTHDGDSGRTLVVETDSDGIAWCRWRPDAGGAPAVDVKQEVVARLLDASGGTLHLPITFSANLSVAAEVAYFPGAECVVLGHTTNVQEALDELCGQHDFVYLGGDGQEAFPGGMLPRPLRVGVTHGDHPVDGALVRFEIIDPTVDNGGRLETPAGTGRAVEVSTLDGVAECAWRLDGDGLTQVVRATLVADGTAIHVPIHFNANQSVAQRISYTPADDCALDVDNVRDALDELCRREHGEGCSITVGEGGEFTTLSEAIHGALKRGLRDICLCLLPGRHEVGGLQLSDEDGARSIKISGCGAASSVVVSGERIHFRRLAAVSLEALHIVTLEDAHPLVFEGTDEVRIQHCVVEGVTSKTPLLMIDDAAQVLLEGNDIEVKTPESFETPLDVLGGDDLLRRLFESLDRLSFGAVLPKAVDRLSELDPGERRELAAEIESRMAEWAFVVTSAEAELYSSLPDLLRADVVSERKLRRVLGGIRHQAIRRVHGFALMFTDSGADVAIDHNEINGRVSFNGQPARLSDVDLSEEDLKTVLSDLRIYRPAGKVLRMTDNQLVEVHVGENFVNQFRTAADQVLSESETVDRIDAFENVLMHGNTFGAPGSEWFAQRTTVEANVFDHDRMMRLSIVLPVVFVSNVMGSTACFVGNQGGPRSMLLNTTVASDAAANVAVNIRNVLP